jgi:galactokinase
VDSFVCAFGSAPAVVASAPGRVNLLGEHTDYNDGYVLPTAIPQRTTVALRPNGGTDFVVHAASLGQQARFGTAAPPAEQFARYVFGCIREVLALGVRVPALDIAIESRVPMGVGLSSSAALEVAVLRALRELLALDLDDVRLARLAQAAEIAYAGVNCGIMDQMACSLADTRRMLFLDTRTLARRLLPLPAGAELLVVDSGLSRSLAGSAYNERRAQCEAAAQRLGVPALRDVTDVADLHALPAPLLQRARHVVTENLRVLQAAGGVDATAFGRLMNASHASLRYDYAVSTASMDRLVGLLQKHGAVFGARLTGAGFGGACVALCRAGEAGRVGIDVLAEYNEGHDGGRVLVPLEAQHA